MPAQKRKYQPSAGIVMVTCRRTLHVYLLRTLDIRMSTRKLKSTLKRGAYYQCAEMQEEYKLYGEKSFSFGCLEEIKMMLNVNTKEHYRQLLEEKFAEALVSVKPYFNTRYRNAMPWRTMKAESFNTLGKRKVASHQVRSFLRKITGFYVLTNSKTGRKGMGYSEDIGKRLGDMRDKITSKRNSVAPLLQQDWDTYGYDSFFVEYFEYNESGKILDVLYNALYERIQPVYTRKTLISRRRRL